MVLGREGGYYRHSITAQSREGLKVRLYASPAATVGSRHRKHSMVFFCHYNPSAGMWVSAVGAIPEKGVRPLLPTHGGSRAVTGKYERVVGEDEYPGTDIFQEKVHVASRKIGATDASCKERISANHCSGRFPDAF